MENFNKSKKIDKFIKSYRSKNTQYNYRASIKKYFVFLNEKYQKSIDPETYIKDMREMKDKERYKVTDRYEEDIDDYYVSLEDLAPKTIALNITALKTFFRRNKIKLSDFYWDDKGAKATGRSSISESKTPTPMDLKKILSHGDTKSRSIFLIEATSGMRLNEVLKLRFEDIDMTKRCPRITLSGRYTKNKERLRTRISPETKGYLEEWFKIRTKALDTASRRSRWEKDINAPQIFPFAPSTARRIWNTLLEKSEYDEKDHNGKVDRNKMGTHSLRRFFRQQFSKYNNDLAKYFMNQRGELDKIYRNYDDDYLDKEYEKGLKYLVVFEKPMDTTHIQEEITDLRGENQKQQKEINDLRMELLAVKLERVEGAMKIKDKQD